VGICPLTERMCIKLGRHPDGLVCYECDPIQKIKDLKACPQLPFLLRPPVGEHSKLPA